MYETTRKDCPMSSGVCCYQYTDGAHYSVSVMYWIKVKTLLKSHLQQTHCCSRLFRLKKKLGTRIYFYLKT